MVELMRLKEDGPIMSGEVDMFRAPPDEDV